MSRLAHVLVLALVVSCAGHAPVASSPPAAAPQDVVAAATALVERWRQAYESRSVDALGTLYAHDPGVVVVTQGTAVVGWTAVLASLTERFAHATAIHVRIKDLQVGELGPTAATVVAAMSREVTDGSMTVAEAGALTFALRKDEAGWLIVAEHFSYKRP